MKTKIKCFECGSYKDIHHHHVVPKSKGGTKTIPLCSKCHGIVHGKHYDLNWKILQRDGIARAQKLNKYKYRKRRGVETPIEFLTKHSKAVTMLENGEMGSYVCKVCNLNKNTITKIKKSLHLIQNPTSKYLYKT